MFSNSRSPFSDHGVNHGADTRDLLVLAQQLALLVPGLRRRVVDRSLADELPADLALLLREGLVVVPVLSVEQALSLADAADVEKREREDRDENVRILTRFENGRGERDFGKIGELLLRSIDADVQKRVVFLRNGLGVLIVGAVFDWVGAGD